MKRLFLSSLIISLFILDNSGQTIRINFIPAFLNPSIATFSYYGDSCKIDLSISDKNNNSTVWSEKEVLNTESLKLLNPLLHFTNNLSDKDDFGFDGITIKVKYTSGNNEPKDLIFWSPGKGSNEYLFFKTTLEILGKTMHTRLSKRYLKILRKYLN